MGSEMCIRDRPNGTTSGCPPPSQHHNYRTLLHTQQRNRFEPCKSARFWMGVAQITRSRERNFIASLCSVVLFSISSIWAHSALREHPSRRVSLFGSRFASNRMRESAESTARVNRERSTTGAIALANTASPAQLHHAVSIASRAGLSINTQRCRRSRPRPRNCNPPMIALQKPLYFAVKMNSRKCDSNVGQRKSRLSD